MTETWANDSITNAMLNIPGYNLEPELRVDRADTTNGIGGGILIYAKNGLVLKPSVKINDFIQYCCFSIEAENSSNDLNCIVFYRSPNSTEANNEKLNEIIKSAPENCIIIGDLNFPKINWETQTSSERKSRSFVEVCEERRLLQIIKERTHISGNILDVALVDNPENCFDIKVLGNLGNSDHSVIELDWCFAGKNNGTEKIVRNWKNCDYDGFRSYLENVNWQAVMVGPTLNEDWVKFREIMHSGIENYVPTRTVRPNCRPAWLNKPTLRAIRKKQRLWRHYKHTQNRDDLNSYKKAEKECKKLIRNSKRRYEKKIANSDEPKQFYSYLRSKTKSKTGVGPLKSNGEVISDEAQIAQLLNEYFCSVFKQEDTNNIPVAADISGNVKVSMIHITEANILKKIDGLKMSSAPGPDKIETRLLKEFCNEICTPLKLIFERSLATGIVPKDWRIAHVTPIYKKGVKRLGPSPERSSSGIGPRTSIISDLH